MTEGTYRLKTMYALDPPEKAGKQFSALFDLKPLRMAHNSGSIENYSWIAGRCVFTQVSIDGNLHYRTADHLSRSGDMLFVHRYLTGGADGRSGDVPYMMRPGPIIFHDYGRPFEGVQMPSIIQSVLFPYELIGYDLNHMPPQLFFDRSSPQGSALHQAFDTLMAMFFEGQERIEKARVSDFARLTSAALPEPDSDHSLQMQVQQFIEENLRDPGLAETDLQFEFQLSRSQLFDQLSALGGFTRYVSTRRVFHALLRLEQLTDQTSSILEIASDGGFHSEYALRDAVKSIYQTDLDTMFER